ncbi:helix-turn-helix domain-containing protein [Thalassospira australica]|uniref:helix-turn-helix domain-containing protein n=1 Tax=Thalassospira australica TaxID=1528106 RepID=UPI00051A4A5B|nr:helix-turn-helix domain-containing protein [Thalassospira australica]
MDDETGGRLRFRPLSGDTPSNDVVMDAENNQSGGYTEVGSLLRATRNGLGQTVEDVCRMLRIRKIYIEAIEASDYSVLPNGPYGLGFVKAYAEYLGLDGAEIARRFREESNAPAVRSELSFPKPVQESRVPGGAVLLIAVMLGLGAYGGWYYLSSQGKTIADLVDPLPERLASYSTTASDEAQPRNLENAADAQAAEAEIVAPAPMISEPENTPATTSEEMAAPASPVVPTENATVAEQPASEPVVTEDTTPATPSEVAEAPAAEEPLAEAEEAPVTNEVAEIAEAPVEEQPAEVPATPAAEVASVPAAPDVDDVGGARVFGAVNVDSRVTISAVETSWVRIREEDGNVLLTRMLSAGDIYKVPNRDGLKLEVGNAGALTYSIDGQDPQPVGDYGAVISDFSLDVGNLTQSEEPTVQ